MWRSQHWGLECPSYFTPDSAFTLGRTPQEGGGQAHRSEGRRMGCWNRGWQRFFLLSQNCSQGPKLRIPSTEGLWSELRNLPGGPAPPHRLRKGLPPTKCQVPCPPTHWWCWKVPEARTVRGGGGLLSCSLGGGLSTARGGWWPGPSWADVQSHRPKASPGAAAAAGGTAKETLGHPGNKCLLQGPPPPMVGRRGCLAGSSDPQDQCLDLL